MTSTFEWQRYRDATVEQVKAETACFTAKRNLLEALTLDCGIVLGKTLVCKPGEIHDNRVVVSVGLGYENSTFPLVVHVPSKKARFLKGTPPPDVWAKWRIVGE